MNSRFNRAPVVIIGGGVAGLTAANLLARKGFAVAIFEASDKPGGSCATTTLGGYTFNDGAVCLALINVLDHAFAKVGINRAEQLPLRKITAKYSATMPDGAAVTLGEGLNLTVTGRAVDSKRVQVELRGMMDKWRPVLRFVDEELLLHPFSSWRMLQKGWRHLRKLRGTVASEFNRLFSDEAVKAALSGDLLYSGLPAESMPVSAILGLVAEIDDGLYLPDGGMGRVPQVLNCALKTRGVPVSLNSKVGKIIIKDGRVCGVETGGCQVDAAAVISTASGMQTFGSLIEAECLPSSIARRLKHPRLSHRAVSIQFGLSNTIEAPAHSVSVLPWMERQQDIFMQDGREVKFPVFQVPTLTMPDLAPRGGSIIEMFYPVRADLPLEYWDEERKERLTESAIAVLRRNYDLHIGITRVRSPKDFRDNMHLFQGALYGLSPASTPRDQFPHTCGIPGLFLAGQTTFPGYGVGAAMMSGIFAAEALLATA
jgi:phytoene desaturase